MRTVSIRLPDLERASIPIGFVGENQHTQVRIDCMKLFEEYPNASAALTVKPPNGNSYPGIVTRENNNVVWVVSDSDLIYEGRGEIQLSFVVSEVVAKSYIGKTIIRQSIIPTGEVPEPLDDFLTRASAALTAIPETIAVALQEAKDSGEFDGYSPTVVVTEIIGGHQVTVTDVNGDHVFLVMDGVDGDPGTPGQDGFSPIATVTKSDDTATISITDKNGTTTATVTDGQDGANGATPVISIGTVSTLSPGSSATASMDTTDPEHPVLSMGIPEGEPGNATIDDTSVANNKVWSAQKVNDLKSAINAFNAGQELFQSYYEHQLTILVGYYDNDGNAVIGGADAGWRTIDKLYTTRLPYISTDPSNCSVWKNGEYLGRYNFSDFGQLPEFDSIAFQWNRNNVPASGIYVKPVGEIYSLLADIDGQVEEINNDIDYIENTTIETNQKTESLTYTETTGFCTVDGNILTGGSYDAYNYSEILQVNSGDVLSFTFLGAGNMRVITAYNNGVAVSEKGVQNTTESYTVPADINGVRFTWYGTALSTATRTYIKDDVKGLPELEERVSALEEQTVTRHITTGMVYQFNINSDNHELDDANTEVEDLFGYSIQFDGRVTTFNGLTIGHGNNTYMGGYVKITPTTFEYYLGTEALPRLSEPHNLTIKDYLSVRIDAKTGINADFTIYTNGGAYKKANQVWDVRRGLLFVNSNGTNVLTGCTFAYMCRGWAEKIHLYGDSYFGVYSDKWTNYLTENNWNKCNVNAYPGRASAEALKVAKNVLNHSNPDMIVWCLGMNDGDDGGTVDATWKACVEELEAICSVRGIELVLATIPNVQTVDNIAKNAYVRASEHRYIDFASAVGASSGTTWYDNMLSSDGIHPSEQGAIALFNQAIADVPELMQ